MKNSSEERNRGLKLGNLRFIVLEDYVDQWKEVTYELLNQRVKNVLNSEENSIIRRFRVELFFEDDDAELSD
jgi:hypothetical protein